MPNAESAVSVVLERDSVPSPDTLEVSKEYTANGRLQAEQTIAVDGLAPEMPVSHPEVDARVISVDGLIKACPHFAHMSERNPELARAKAAEVVQYARDHEAMRESGLNDAEIKKQQWAAMRERHKQKMQTNEKQDIKSASAHSTTAEQMSEIIRQQAVVGREQKTAEILSEQSKPAVSEPEKLVERQDDTMQRLQYEAAQSAQQDLATDRLVREQQVHEAVQIIAPEETVQTFVSPKSQPIFEQEQDERTGEQVATEPANHAHIEPTNGTSIASEAASDIELIEPIGWADKLNGESLPIYEDFIQTLQLASPNERPIPEVAGEPTMLDKNRLVIADETYTTEDVPAITITVAERLSEIEVEEREAISLVIADIVEIVQTIEVLTAEEAEPEAVVAMQVELAACTIELFEQLGIEYEPEDVEKFIAVLFRPDFRPPQTEAAEVIVDLEHDGTHEAKRHFPQLFSGLADGEDKTQDFLGKLILFYVIGSRSRTQTPAY